MSGCHSLSSGALSERDGCVQEVIARAARFFGTSLWRFDFSISHYVSTTNVAILSIASSFHHYYMPMLCMNSPSVCAGHQALSVYVALCYYKLDYYDVSMEVTHVICLCLFFSNADICLCRINRHCVSTLPHILPDYLCFFFYLLLLPCCP